MTDLPPAANDPQRNAQPARVLALDVGERRTGVAVSDELAMFAHPRPAIVAASRIELLEQVRRRIADESATEVIVGLPISMSGTDTAQTVEVRAFARDLRGLTGILVTEVDERLSTREASNYVRGREARKSGVQDSAAAAIILQSVLDNRRGAHA